MKTKPVRTHYRIICLERIDRNLNGMISVGFKSAEAETQASTPDDAALGQHRVGFRDLQGEPDQQP